MRQSLREFVPRSVAVLRDRGTDAGQRIGVIGIRVPQLVDERHQHIEFADVTEPPGDPAEPPAQFARGVGVELKNGDDLAQPSRRDARPMQRAHIARVHTREHAGQLVEAGFEQMRATGRY